MLVLSRKPGESIVIGDVVVVTVVETRGGNVRLGIAAPKEIPVHRQEIHQRIQHEALAIAAAHGEPVAEPAPPAAAQQPAASALSRPGEEQAGAGSAAEGDGDPCA